MSLTAINPISECSCDYRFLSFLIFLFSHNWHQLNIQGSGGVSLGTVRSAGGCLLTQTNNCCCCFSDPLS